MIKTTFEFLAVFAVLLVLLHFLLLPKIRSRRFWFCAEWFAVFAIAVGCIIAVAELRGLTQRRRLQDLDAYIQIRQSIARGRTQEMILICRKFIEMSKSSNSSSLSQFQEGEQWAVAASEALRPRYEAEGWLRFLEKNSSVKANEDPAIQQLKLSLIVLLGEMRNGYNDLREREQELHRRGQLFWLAPYSSWLLAFGFALWLTQVSAEWKNKASA